MKKLFSLLFTLLLVIPSCKKNSNNTISNIITQFTVNDTLDDVTNKTCNIAILLGQSNATGVSWISELGKNDKTIYDTYISGYDNVKINYITENGSNSSNNTFVKTVLGQGASLDHFGPEIGIAEKLNSSFQNIDNFIIKYSWGGSVLDSHWLNSNYERGQMYTAAINFIKVSLDYLILKGYTLNILGICWMQGESDAFDGISQRYEKNTQNFVSFLRTDLSSYSNSIKFIDAYIEDITTWPKYSEINQAKLNFSNSNSLNYIVDTIQLGLSTANEPTNNIDIAHYDSISMVTLGRNFGDLLLPN